MKQQSHPTVSRTQARDSITLHPLVSAVNHSKKKPVKIHQLYFRKIRPTDLRHGTRVLSLSRDLVLGCDYRNSSVYWKTVSGCNWSTKHHNSNNKRQCVFHCLSYNINIFALWWNDIASLGWHKEMSINDEARLLYKLSPSTRKKTSLQNKRMTNMVLPLKGNVHKYDWFIVSPPESQIRLIHCLSSRKSNVSM